MKVSSRSSFIVIGMALFAMFFGSGNLIYPLFIGMKGSANWLSTTLGFTITAVILPFLGVVAMVVYGGNYDRFFQVLGKGKGFLLCIVLLTVWIPLGSAARCMTLSYASMNSYFGTMPPAWIFGLIYSALVFLVMSSKMGILDFLGRIITPLLLACIGFITYRGFLMAPKVEIFQTFDKSVFLHGLFEGYHTMDLIASFFFSASVIHMINHSSDKLSNSLKLVFKSSVVGMGILALVYVCLIGLSAHYSDHIQEVPKDQILAYLSLYILGPHLAFVAILAIVLACFSTSVALILVYTDFLHEELFQAKQHPRFSMLLSLAVTYLISLFGLQGITTITSPILQICYPLLLGLIVFNVGRYYIKGKAV